MTTNHLTPDEYFKRLAKTRFERQLTRAEKAALLEIVKRLEYLPGGERLIDPVCVLPTPQVLR